MRRLLILAGVTALLAAVVHSEFCRALVLGWVIFLARVLPRIRPNPASLALGCVTLVLFTLVLHGVGKAWMRDAATGQSGWKLRWSLAGTGAVLVLFAAGLAGVGIVHQVGWLSTSPEPLWRPVARLSYQRRSSENLRDIAWQLKHGTDYRKSELPRGGLFSPDGTGLHSWETQIIYYGFTYDPRAIHLDRPYTDPSNAPVFRSLLPVFINSSLRQSDLFDADGYGLSHYSANSHIMNAGPALKLTDITDSQSATILVGEIKTAFPPWGHPVNWRDPALGINRSAQTFGGPWSAGGTNFLMVDGSVHFISDRVSPDVLRALATPRGGEAVDPSVCQPPQFGW
jgi:prepilin-type processing-associated H-X9-DG protein